MSTTALEQTLILVVDDDPVCCQLIEMHLVKQGANVLIAHDRQQTLDILKKQLPEIILLDVMLPDTSGIEICKELKQKPELKAIPIIFTTSMSDADFKIRGLEAGASDYLTKPYAYEEITLRLQLHLSLVRKQKELEVMNQKLQNLAEIDYLTQVPNRRRFEAVFDQEWRRNLRNQTPLSLMIFDLDFFKAYNDSLGHPQGDQCLIEVAACVKNCLKRPADFLARIGGEEFTILLPNTPAEGASFLAGCILNDIKTLAIPHPDSPIASHVSLSLGFACHIPTQTSKAESLMLEADRALYLAKAAGRNCARNLKAMELNI